MKLQAGKADRTLSGRAAQSRGPGEAVCYGYLDWYQWRFRRSWDAYLAELRSEPDSCEAAQCV